MARMAACLMLSGVGKSGSPAPKSTTSMPCRRSRSASAATFIVEDTLIGEMRSAIAGLQCGSRTIRIISLLILQAACAAALPPRAAPAREISPPSAITSFTSRELMNECASLDIRKRSQLGRQPAVHQRHLEFVFVIGDGADAAQDHGGPLRLPHSAPAGRRNDPLRHSGRCRALRAASPCVPPR